MSASHREPAALGFSGNPQTSGSIGTIQFSSGLKPVTLSDLEPFSGELVPVSVKARWLGAIEGAGGHGGGAGFDMTWATVQSGRFALQVASSGRARSDISPGFAELMLFGNVDDAGNASNLDLADTRFDVEVHSSLALSFGMPIRLAASGSRLAIGATVKYTLGHVLVLSDTSRGSATAEPLTLELRFPIAYSSLVAADETRQLTSGRGFGVDVAIGYEVGNITLAAVAQNVFNNFAWDEDRLRFRAAELLFNDTVRHTTFTTQPLTAAPASLRERVADREFKPAYALGAQLRATPRLAFAADARWGDHDSMSTRPPVHAGAGADYQPLEWLSLQAGFAYVQLDRKRAGAQLAGGVRVYLGGFMLGVSGAQRRVDPAENLLMVTLLAHRF